MPSASAVFSRRLRALLSGVALMALCALPACGGDDEGKGTAEAKADTPAPRATSRFQTPEYAFTTRAAAPRSDLTVGGRKLSGRGQLLVPVRVRLANRQHRRLTIGQMNADLRSQKKSYAPILADGREQTEPIFAETSVARGAAASSLLVYRVPRGALSGVRLSVTDPARHQSFKLVLF
jgi:hypothetical protein